jgi:electron transfer flavoprotein alpha subunit
MPVLALAEHRRGELRDPSFEAITAGRELADAASTELHLAVVGGDVDGFADSLNREGVDAIHTVAHGEAAIAVVVHVAELAQGGLDGVADIGVVAADLAARLPCTHPLALNL